MSGWCGTHLAVLDTPKARPASCAVRNCSIDVAEFHSAPPGRNLAKSASGSNDVNCALIFRVSRKRTAPACRRIVRARPGPKCATSPGRKPGIWTPSTRVRHAMRQPGPSPYLRVSRQRAALQTPDPMGSDCLSPTSPIASRFDDVPATSLIHLVSLVPKPH